MIQNVEKLKEYDVSSLIAAVLLIDSSPITQEDPVYAEGRAALLNELKSRDFETVIDYMKEVFAEIAGEDY